MSASEDKYIRLWNKTSGELVRTLNGHTTWVQSITFTPDGNQLGGDMTLRVCNVSTGDCIHTLEGLTHGITSVIVSADGKRVISSSGDGLVHVWEVRSWSLLSVYQTSTLLWSVAVSPDGEQIVSGGDKGMVHLWENISSHRLVPLTSVRLSSSGPAIQATFGDVTSRRWDVGASTTGIERMEH